MTGDRANHAKVQQDVYAYEQGKTSRINRPSKLLLNALFQSQNNGTALQFLSFPPFLRELCGRSRFGMLQMGGPLLARLNPSNIQNLWGAEIEMYRMSSNL